MPAQELPVHVVAGVGHQVVNVAAQLGAHGPFDHLALFVLHASSAIPSAAYVPTKFQPRAPSSTQSFQSRGSPDILPAAPCGSRQRSRCTRNTLFFSIARPCVHPLLFKPFPLIGRLLTLLPKTQREPYPRRPQSQALFRLSCSL